MQRVASEEVGLGSLHIILDISKQICIGRVSSASASTAQLPSLQERGAAVGVDYILEVVQQVGDGLALGVGEDIVVVNLRPAGAAAEEQLAAEIAHGVGRGLASRRCRSRPTAMGGFLSRARLR